MFVLTISILPHSSNNSPAVAHTVDYFVDHYQTMDQSVGYRYLTSKLKVVTSAVILLKLFQIRVFAVLEKTRFRDSLTNV